MLNTWDWPEIPQIRAADPHVVILVYKDLSSTRTDACQGGVDQSELPTGVGYCDANAHHPEWFSTHRGQRIVENGYPTQLEMNVGDPRYQQLWLTNVMTDLEAHGWDGVWIDNALTECGAYGPCPDQYQTNAAMQAATRAMLAHVSPPLQQAGFVTVANISDARLFPGLWTDWLSLVSGAEEEHFVNSSSIPGQDYVWNWGPDGWTAMVDEITTAEQMGKFVMAATQGALGDQNALMYALSSFLLATDGRSAFSCFADPGTQPEYSWQLGAPKGSYYVVPGTTSLYKRDFAAGTVIVNASGDAPATIPLGAGYLDPAGSVVTSITLAPERGTILRVYSNSEIPHLNGSSA